MQYRDPTHSGGEDSVRALKPAKKIALLSSNLRILQPRDIAVIEEAIKKIGASGEIRLVVQGGRIRFVRTLKSEAIEDVELS